MPNKVDYCPKCHAELVSIGNTMRKKCKTPGCNFSERRGGMGVVDPLIDRRSGSTRHFVVDDTKCPWRSERWSKS